MDTVTLRSHLEKFLGRLSRLDYLAVFSAIEVSEADPATVVARLPGALKRYSNSSPDESGRSLNEKAIEVRAEQILELKSELPGFVVDLLVVDLEAFLHGFLSDAAEVDVANDSSPLETLLSKLWPGDARWAAQERRSGRGPAGRAEHWSYSDVVLLSEVRNAIVHGNGEVLLARSRQRLLNAGWSDESLKNLRLLRERGLNDLFRFKRAVRTIANEVLTYAELSPST
jgi:hypothetical protein